MYINNKMNFNWQVDDKNFHNWPIVKPGPFKQPVLFTNSSLSYFVFARLVEQVPSVSRKRALVRTGAVLIGSYRSSRFILLSHWFAQEQ